MGGLSVGTFARDFGGPIKLQFSLVSLRPSRDVVRRLGRGRPTLVTAAAPKEAWHGAAPYEARAARAPGVAATGPSSRTRSMWQPASPRPVFTDDPRGARDAAPGLKRARAAAVRVDGASVAAQTALSPISAVVPLPQLTGKALRDRTRRPGLKNSTSRDHTVCGVTEQTSRTQNDAAPASNYA